jgi:Spy/CpxP family protein refolding chaperone
MKFIYNNRLMFWVLLFLVVINITALVSNLLFTRPKNTPPCGSPNEQSCGSLCQELALSSEQEKLVADINNTYTQAARPLASAIKETRVGILNELEKEHPDSILLQDLTRSVADLQLKIQQENIRQYTALKRVCTPEQAQKLSTLYRDLYGCPMKNEQGSHRFRHGQGNTSKGKHE